LRRSLLRPILRSGCQNSGPRRLALHAREADPPLPFLVRLSIFFFFKQKTAYEIGLGIPAEPLFRSTCRKCPHKVHRMEMKTAISCTILRHTKILIAVGV